MSFERPAHQTINRQTGALSRSFQERRWSRRSAVFLLLAILAVVGWTYVVFASDLFIVHEIQTPGLQQLEREEVEREVYAMLDARSGWRPWSARHIWFVDTTALEKELKDKLFVLSVTVDKVGGNVLRLKIEERPRRFVFYSHRQYFWSDMHGVLTDVMTLEETRQAQSRILGQRAPLNAEPPLIHQDFEQELKIGQSIADPSIVQAWVKVTEALTKAGILYREFNAPTPSSTVAVIRSQDGFPVVLDTSEPLEGQLATLKAFLQNKPKNLVVNEYVDVRIPGRIYVK